MEGWKRENISNKDVLPLETIQFAVKEAKSWRLAQRTPELVEDPIEEELQTDEQPQPRTSCPPLWSCQTDASWINKDERAGLGFVVMYAGKPMLYGARELSRATSSLHAEAEGLIWAMQEVLKTRNRSVQFEMDCKQLVKLIQSEEDWPSMAAEIDEIKALSLAFLEISIIHIPRSSNVRADSLAKGGRS
ncbi:uncharacterized protein LOC111203536 [Brassica napus]|uniref:uncharacterized protein LOC111203536 n=1 Tax=Brassica napus TaxID=3708 RepID=UPI00207A70DD|nr:uncharacterized protein LOC111203536 [Brassica napus]